MINKIMQQRRENNCGQLVRQIWQKKNVHFVLFTNWNTIINFSVHLKKVFKTAPSTVYTQENVLDVLFSF